MTVTDLRPLVICGPSGSGKTTLLKKLLTEFPDIFSYSTIDTTRAPRPGEIDGVHYHFITFEEFKLNIENNRYLEYSEYIGNFYGTRIDAIERIAKFEKISLLDMNYLGVQNLKEADINPWCVFITAISTDILKERLSTRGYTNNLEKRIEIAEEENNYGMIPGNFDLLIINDDLERAYLELKNFLTQNKIIV